MKTKLADEKCNEADAKQLRLPAKEIAAFKKQLSGWKLVSGKKLEKKLKFPDFKAALKYVVKVGNLAEKQGHHPDIFLTYGAVHIQLSTHSVKGLTENDFILAAKIDRVS
ncbi:MAG TPA: 4a-hydroxytetrahydrobiopterin dehydratase [Verrucomicrobiae bacterium]